MKPAEKRWGGKVRVIKQESTGHKYWTTYRFTWWFFRFGAKHLYEEYKYDEYIVQLINDMAISEVWVNHNRYANSEWAIEAADEYYKRHYVVEVIAE